MRDNPLVSIIIPAYNVEAYICKCLDSLINQSYRKIEILVVDDGSTDLTAKKILEYSDTRIVYIYQENKGQSSARNNGLTRVCGDIVCFVDSDDWLELNAIEEIVYAMKEKNCDIVLFDYFLNNCGKDQKGPSLKSGSYSKEDILKRLVQDVYLQSFVWNKAYKKEVFHNVSFPEGKIYEDTLILPKLIMNANSFYMINKPLYHYLYREGSTVREKKLRSLKGLVDATVERNESLCAIYPQLSKVMITADIRIIRNALCGLINMPREDEVLSYENHLTQQKQMLLNKASAYDKMEEVLFSLNKKLYSKCIPVINLLYRLRNRLFI